MRLRSRQEPARAGGDALAARPRHAARLRAVLVAPRPHGRPRPHHHARAGRHRLCGRLRPARRLRSLRHHRAAARLCAVRTEPNPGAGAGLLARADHPRRRPVSVGGDPMRAVAIAGAMAIVSGLVCMLAGILRLGFITELLSKPIRYGYMNGIALTVLISQLPKLLGLFHRSRRTAAQPAGRSARRWRTARSTGRPSPSAPARWWSSCC